MQSEYLACRLAGLWCLLTAPACHMTPQPSNVTYGASQPIGSWSTGGAAVGGGGASAGNAIYAAGSGSASTNPGLAPQASRGVKAGAQAGSGAAAPAAGTAGAGGDTGTAGAGGDTGLDTGTNAVQSLAFDVTTGSQGGRYEPKNIGAIWIQDEQGGFVKSLQVWASIRERWLTKYNRARGATKIDVVSSATLTRHVPHHVTWDMKDRSGATVPDGKYSIFVELTDQDSTGQFTSVGFDTRPGPQTITPTDTPYYFGMKLQLQ